MIGFRQAYKNLKEATMSTEVKSMSNVIQSLKDLKAPPTKVPARVPDCVPGCVPGCPTDVLPRAEIPGTINQSVLHKIQDPILNVPKPRDNDTNKEEGVDVDDCDESDEDVLFLLPD